MGSLSKILRCRSSLLHGGIPVLLIVRQIDLHLSALGFGFLQAKYVGLVALPETDRRRPFFGAARIPLRSMKRFYKAVILEVGRCK